MSRFPQRTVRLNDGNEIPVLAFGTGKSLYHHITHTASSAYHHCLDRVGQAALSVSTRPRSTSRLCRTASHEPPASHEPTAPLGPTAHLPDAICTSQAGTDTAPVVSAALSHGLVHIDSAYHYKNGKHTGEAIRASGLPRDRFYITTKGASFDSDPNEFDARFFLEENLKDLGLEYVDLYLIHADILVANVQTAWKQMEQMKKDGLTKSIGVSNFSTKSLQAVLDVCEIPPAVNQIEFHPYSLPTYLPTLLPLQATHGIVTEAYAPLLSVVRRPGGPVDAVVGEVVAARGLDETPGQVLLRWAQQVTGGVVVTTTKNEARMQEQIAPFLLSSPAPPLAAEHLDAISRAGAAAPYRHWGVNWPYFMQGEGGIDACGPGKDHRVKPVNRDDLKTVTATGQTA